jgi:hypothetical protein
VYNGLHLQKKKFLPYLPHPVVVIAVATYINKKEKEIFLIYQEIVMGSVAKSYMRKGFLIYEEMCKYLTINEEAVSYIYDFATAPF